MRGEHRRLPHLAFFHLAVAEKGENIAILAGELCRQSKADRPRQPLTERAANQIGNRRALAADRLELGAILAVGSEFCRIEPSGLGSHGV